MTAINTRHITLLFVVLLVLSASLRANAQSVVIINGLDEAIAWLESENWWGEEKHDEQLQVPHAIVTGIPASWQKTSQSLPVAQKKEIFYRFMLPLIMHANCDRYHFGSSFWLGGEEFQLSDW